MLTFKRAEKLSKKAAQIFLPVIDGKAAAPELAKLFQLNFEDELAFFAPSDKPLKAGEIFEIPVSAEGYKCERLAFVSLGKASASELRQAGAAVGRKLRGKSDDVYLHLDLKKDETKSFLVSANLGNFTWNLKSDAKTFISNIEVRNGEIEVLKSAQLVSDAVNRARN